MTVKHIYLASDSPRRLKLLKEILSGRFRVIRHLHNEDSGIKEPAKHVRMNALGKALTASKKVKNGIVIGADTIVVSSGKILGKPGTAVKAAKMLRAISGRKITVLTGIAVIDSVTGKRSAGVETTKLLVKKLAAGDIDRYVRTGEPMDKAGAFGIQGKGRAIIESMSGDYSNVVGLPQARLAAILLKYGVRIKFRIPDNKRKKGRRTS